MWNFAGDKSRIAVHVALAIGRPDIISCVLTFECD
jgi:hypothetical protein